MPVRRRDFAGPLSAGFSRINTRRSASSAVISPPDSITSRLMSS